MNEIFTAFDKMWGRLTATVDTNGMLPIQLIIKEGIQGKRMLVDIASLKKLAAFLHRLFNK